MKGQKRVEKLAPRLRETYAALMRLENHLGAPPAIRELVRELGLEKRHISRVHGDLETLVKMGLAERKPIPTRRFSATGPAPDEVDWEKLVGDP